MFYPHCFLASVKGGISSSAPAVLGPALGWPVGKEDTQRVLLLPQLCLCKRPSLRAEACGHVQSDSLVIWHDEGQLSLYCLPENERASQSLNKGTLEEETIPPIFLVLSYLLEKRHGSWCNVFKELWSQFINLTFSLEGEIRIQGVCANYNTWRVKPCARYFCRYFI